MEKQILDLIEEEVCRRTQLKMNEILSKISGLYDIPLERLIKDTAKCETKFCQGILKTGQRCLKKPKENGFCKFHFKKAPQEPEPVQEEKATWEVI